MAGYAHVALASSIKESNVRTIIDDPLNHIGPSIVSGPINNGISTIASGSPAQFYPSQVQPNYEDNIVSKQMYFNMRNPTIGVQPSNIPVHASSTTSGKRILVSNNVNYTAPLSNSSYIANKKAVAIGQYTYRVGLADGAPLSSKSVNLSKPQSTLSHLRRSGGNPIKMNFT